MVVLLVSVFLLHSLGSLNRCTVVLFGNKYFKILIRIYSIKEIIGFILLSIDFIFKTKTVFGNSPSAIAGPKITMPV